MQKPLVTKTGGFCFTLASSLETAMLKIDVKSIPERRGSAYPPPFNEIAKDRVRQRLDDGAFVGILGDRTLGNEPLQEVSFLGSRAYFPVGPMRAAALLGRPMIFMLGLYRGANRYHLVFELVADFSTVGRAERAAAVAEAVVLAGPG